MGDVGKAALEGQSPFPNLPQFGIVVQKAKAFCTLCLIGISSACICQRAAADSVPLKPTRKPVFGWLVSAGYTKKEREITVASKLDPMICTLFF